MSKRSELPSEPVWDDVLPRLCTTQDAALPFGASVPGGEVVAQFRTERLGREFIAFLGRQYVDRADQTLRALDEIAERDFPEMVAYTKERRIPTSDWSDAIGYPRSEQQLAPRRDFDREPRRMPVTRRGKDE